MWENKNNKITFYGTKKLKIWLQWMHKLIKNTLSTTNRGCKILEMNMMLIVY